MSFWLVLPQKQGGPSPLSRHPRRRPDGISRGFESCVTPGVTRLEFITEGILLREMLSDPLLTRFSAWAWEIWTLGLRDFGTRDVGKGWGVQTAWADCGWLKSKSMQRTTLKPCGNYGLLAFTRESVGIYQRIIIPEVLR